MKSVIEAMKWRYATQKFDITKKLTEAQIDELLQAIVLSPSSFGLQPWKFILVTNPEIRKKLREVGYNQPKITEASHLIVFAVEKNIDGKLADKFIESISKTRDVNITDLKGYADMLKGSIASRTPEQNIEWATRQVYLALGVLVTSAAIQGIDVGPMEGFDPKKFDEILDLEKIGLESKVIVAIGFRASDDPSASYKKVRYPQDEIIIRVK